MNMRQAKIRLESWYNGEDIDISPELLDCAYNAINFYLKVKDIESNYMIDDFIEEINSVYDDAKKRGFDSIVLTIETDTEHTYYINDTKDGFQCDEFDYYFEDLDSIAEILFNEKIIGKPTEISVE